MYLLPHRDEYGSRQHNMYYQERLVETFANAIDGENAYQ